MTNRIPILDKYDHSKLPIGFIEFIDSSFLETSDWTLAPGYVIKDTGEIQVLCAGAVRSPKC